MAVQLVLGPTGSGKTRLATDRLRQHDPLSWCRKVRLIVPTTEQVRQIETFLLAEDGVPGFLGSPVCTFYNFAADIIAEAGLRAKLISDVQKRLTLTDLLAEAKLSYFRAASSSPGFVEALDQIIGEMKVSMIEPRELEYAIDALADQLPPRAVAKARELAGLYQSYQQEVLIENSVHDREGVMWRALEILRDRKLLQGYDMFILDGFDQFTGVQKEFLRLITEQVSEVVVTIPYEPNRPDVFQWSEPAVEFIRSLGVASQTTLPRPQSSGCSLSVIEEKLFSPTPDPVPCDDSLAIIEGGSPRMEAEMAAAEIVRLMRTNVSPDDIAIVARDYAAYHPLLAEALTRHGIRYVQNHKPVRQTALARFITTALEICMSSWRRDHVISILKSPLLSPDLRKAFAVEVRAKQQGLIGGRKSWFEPWGTEDDTAEYRKTALDPIVALDDSIARANGTADFVRAIKGLLDLLSEKMDDEQLAQNAASDRAIKGVLEELERTEEIVGHPITKEQLRELFLAGIAEADYSAQDAHDSGVSIIKAESTAGQKFDVVFVVGLLEKVFPRQVREEPFFRDSERRLLNTALGGKLSERLSGQSHERFLFYSALTAAKKKLYLTYPIADSAAKDSLPSFYLDEVKKLFAPGTIRTLTRNIGDVIPAPWDAETYRGKIDGLVYGAVTGCFDMERLAAVYDSLDDKSVLHRALSAAIDLPPAVTDDRILTHTKNSHRRFKATELENFASCPYKHFCCHVLGLEKVREEVTALNQGIILHDVLCKLFRNLRERCGESLILNQVDLQGLQKEATALLDAAVERDAMLANLPGYLLDIERRRLAGALCRFLEMEITQAASGFVPTYFELAFGIGSAGNDCTLPASGEGQEVRAIPHSALDCDPNSVSRPLTLASGDMTVQICGKIDRVDVDPQNGMAIAIDYKLSTVPSQKELDEGIKLQAPLYAIALRELFGLKPVGSHYRSIYKRKNDGYLSPDYGKSTKLSAQDFEERLDWCVERVMKLAERIRNSDIDANPVKGACDNCNLESLCRIDPWKRMQMLTEEADNGGD